MVKQGVLYLQLQQTFGKVRRGRGGCGAAGEDPQRGGRQGWAWWGSIPGRGKLPPIGSPPTRQLSTSTLGQRGWEMGARCKRKHPAPRPDPPSSTPQQHGQSRATSRCNPRSLVASAADNGRGSATAPTSTARRGRSGQGVSWVGAGAESFSLWPQSGAQHAPGRGRQAGHRHPDDASMAEATLGAQKQPPAKGSHVLARLAGAGSCREDALVLLRDFLCRCLPPAAAGASRAQSALNCAASEGESFRGVV